jgi:tight adherence protein B
MKLPTPSLAFSTLPLMKWGSLVLVGLGLFGATFFALSDTGGPIYRYSIRYISWMERRLRLMFIFVSGKLIFSVQLAAMFLYLATALLVGIPFWFAGVIVIAAGPAVWILQEQKKRREAIEMQLDNFVLALANALKSTPSIGGALNSVVSVITEPMRSEIDLATKEMRVGSTLDQALLHMASRIGSRSVDTALSAVLIGRQVGGNLPRVLETTATSLREMQRLEGVIRSKTADGRMQLWVIGAMPLGLIFGMDSMWPGFYKPLTADLVGYAIIVFVVICWGAALVLARKILAVDI